MAKRKRGYGKVKITLDSVLGPAVGGTAAMGTALILRGFVNPYKMENEIPVMEADGITPVKNWAFQYAGLLGMGAGLVGSAILGPFRGWGVALTGGIAAVLGGLTAQLYNTVVPEENKGGIGIMVARRAPYGQMVYDRGQAKLSFANRGYGQQMFAQQANPAFPENVTAFPQDYVKSVNRRAFGGQ